MWVLFAVVRTLVGLGFVAAGASYFLVKMEPPPGLPESAVQMMGVLVPTGWLAVVKVLETAGGLLLLSGRLAPLGIVVLMPIAVNIALWDLLLIRQPAAGVIAVGLLAALMYAYRRYFLPFFVPDAKIGA
jgi:uncharacterized membrane protein YphA (DoxX/SURF4 family)